MNVCSAVNADAFPVATSSKDLHNPFSMPAMMAGLLLPNVFESYNVLESVRASGERSPTKIILS